MEIVIQHGNQPDHPTALPSGSLRAVRSGGTLLPAFGVIVAGPHYNEWPDVRPMLTVVGSLFLGGVVGYPGGEMAVASIASGPGPGSAEGSDGGAGGGGESGGGDGGGGGGDP